MKRYFVIPLLMLLISYWSEAQNVGTPAPDFTLNKLGGGSFNSSAQNGKVVFIFFFGYACPHCLANGPNTQSGIYEVYKDHPDFVAVGVDTWDGNSAGVQNFKSRTGIEYQLCLNGGSVEKTYQTTYDRIVIIDQSGIIRFKSTSDATNDVVAQARTVIENLLENSDGMEEEEEMDDMMKEEVVTGLSEGSAAHARVILSPMPVTQMLTVTSGILSEGDFTVQVYDIKGKEILRQKSEGIEDESYEMQLPVLADGLYLLHLNSKNYSLTQKFIVRK